MKSKIHFRELVKSVSCEVSVEASEGDSNDDVMKEAQRLYLVGQEFSATQTMRKQ